MGRVCSAIWGSVGVRVAPRDFMLRAPERRPTAEIEADSEEMKDRLLALFGGKPRPRAAEPASTSTGKL